MVADEWGGIICVWQLAQAPPDSQDIFALRIEGDGLVAPGWPSSGRQLTDSGENSGVNAVADASGGTYVCWYADRSTTLVIQRLLGDGAIAAGWPVRGYRVSLGDRVDWFYPAALVNDGAGGVFAIWRGRREDADYGVYAIHLGPDATPASGWPASGFRLARTSDFPLRVRGCTDGAGGAWAVWDDRRSDAGDIHALRIPSTADTLTWTGNPFLVCTAAGMQQKPVLTPDDSGGVVIAWEDSRAGPERDIYAARLLPTGQMAAGWPADGVAVCTGPSHQYDVDIVGDQAHGAILVWVDQRNDPGPRIYNLDLFAQRVSGAGIVGSAEPPPPPPPPPSQVALLPARPNPASGAVQIPFVLPQSTPVTAEVVDIHGRLVRDLARGVIYPAGTHRFTWDGLDAEGRRVRPGVYLVRFTAGALDVASKVCILR